MRKSGGYSANAKPFPGVGPRSVSRYTTGPFDLLCRTRRVIGGLGAPCGWREAPSRYSGYEDGSCMPDTKPSSSRVGI
jgi:hypothetical protein